MELIQVSLTIEIPWLRFDNTVLVHKVLVEDRGTSYDIFQTRTQIEPVMWKLW